MRGILFACLAILLAAPAAAQEAKSFTGHGLAVDGDTLLVNKDGRPTQVRLWGIKAPDLGSWPWGPLARAALDDLLTTSGPLVRCQPRGYARAVSSRPARSPPPEAAKGAATWGATWSASASRSRTGFIPILGRGLSGCSMSALTSPGRPTPAPAASAFGRTRPGPAFGPIRSPAWFPNWVRSRGRNDIAEPRRVRGQVWST